MRKTTNKSLFSTTTNFYYETIKGGPSWKHDVWCQKIFTAVELHNFCRCHKLQAAEPHKAATQVLDQLFNIQKRTPPQMPRAASSGTTLDTNDTNRSSDAGNEHSRNCYGGNAAPCSSSMAIKWTQLELLRRKCSPVLFVDGELVTGHPKASSYLVLHVAFLAGLSMSAGKLGSQLIIRGWISPNCCSSVVISYTLRSVLCLTSK